MSRRSGLTIQFAALGNGQVNTVMQRDLLVPPDKAFLDAPLSPRAENLRMLNGFVAPRPGYRTIGTTPATSAVTGLWAAQFDNNVVEYLRSDQAKTYWLSAGTWTDITAAGVGGNWTYAMVRRAGGAAIANQVMFGADGDSDNVWRYVGGGTAATSVSTGIFKGARVIVGHRGRSLVANVFDIGLTARKNVRVCYSIDGDPSTHTGAGSGFVDLDDDPYPIVGGRVIAGNVCLFKGNNIAGSIVVGTLTGNYLAPYRWDTINTAEVGLLVPRSLVSLTADLAFFLGHDGFYLYDGARGLSRVADGVNQDVLTRINPGALRAGFAWVKPALGEIHVALAMGSATYPNETWVFNFKERRVYGPYLYANTLTAATTYATTDALTWDTIPFSSWDSMTYTSWDTMGGIASARGVLLGASNGTTWLDDEVTPSDAGAANVTGRYYFPPLRASGRTLLMPDGSQRPLEEDGYLILRDVTLTYRNAGSWLPLVEASTDGGSSWTPLSAGAAIGDGSTNLDRSLTAPYTADAIPGTWFQLRVSGSSPMKLLGARMEFTYGGNSRSD